jgi:hypothetical protein
VKYRMLRWYWNVTRMGENGNPCFTYEDNSAAEDSVKLYLTELHRSRFLKYTLTFDQMTAEMVTRRAYTSKFINVRYAANMTLRRASEYFQFMVLCVRNYRFCESRVPDRRPHTDAGGLDGRFSP